MPDDPYGYLAGLSAHPDRAGDTSNFNPQFASALAASIQQARAAGLPVSLMSGFRAPGQTGSAYDAGGYSSHSYGLASDIAGLDGPNGKITQQWAQIAQANGLHNPYGVGNSKEFNHWQLPDQPLEKTPQLLSSLKSAAATGNFQNVWNAYGGSPAPTQVASAAPTPPPRPSGLTADSTPSQISQSIIANESGGRNVTSPQGAVGPGQIMPGTFAQYAQPGENIHNPADNMAVHNRIIADYTNRWPNDPARVATAYFSGPGNVAPPGSPNPWKNNVSDVNESVSKYVANAMGTPGTTINTAPVSTAAAAPAAPQSIIGKLAAGTGTDGKGPSAIQSLATAAGGGTGGGQSNPDEAPRQQQMLPVNNQQQQMLSSQGQQLAAQIQARAATPLTWNSKTPGAGLQSGAMTPVNIGGQIIPMPPGMTLNSMGNLYG